MIKKTLYNEPRKGGPLIKTKVVQMASTQPRLELIH